MNSDIVYGPNSDELQIGFLAQEVEEILPEIVTTDPEGNKAINYNSIIPILVKSVQELQAQVEEQNSIIENLKNQNTLLANEKTDRITGCTPNPTQGEITIGYEISEGVTSVRILITNLIGTAVAMEECSINNTSIAINLAGLNPGLYLATLICNGDVKDSKQIVVSR